MADFTGKVGLIVGVANHRSLAWAIAQATSKGGANLILTYQGRFEEHVAELADTLTPKPMVLPLDVTSDEQIASVYQKIQETHGGLDFVVHGVAFAVARGNHRPFSQYVARGFQAGARHQRPTR
jgi:enoyl-[acyl-carrier protein] reductase I